MCGGGRARQSLDVEALCVCRLCVFGGASKTVARRSGAGRVRALRNQTTTWNRGFKRSSEPNDGVEPCLHALSSTSTAGARTYVARSRTLCS